uniref:Uncharacterized protein n=1 Tax=Romanomermis culicivorax TaxID=13658 RepID=A0A915HXM6_ROMCU
MDTRRSDNEREIRATIQKMSFFNVRVVADHVRAGLLDPYHDRDHPGHRHLPRAVRRLHRRAFVCHAGRRRLGAYPRVTNRAGYANDSVIKKTFKNV